MYFGEFLRDAGVQVTTELAEKAGAVLFSVSPADPKIALRTVREALSIYLSLPQSAVSRTSEAASLAERKLEANIDHLHHQLQLLNVIATSQELRLRDRETAMSAQQQLISQLLPRASTDDREEFLGGSVALTKVERAGVEFNLAKIFRHVRNLFSRRKNRKTA